MTTSLMSTAAVSTDAPARYAKQLVSHLGRRIAFTSDGPRFTAEVGTGRAEIVIGEGVLTLVASGPDAETLHRVQDVLGRHLERFGQRNELVVSWSEPA